MTFSVDGFASPSLSSRRLALFNRTEQASGVDLTFNNEDMQITGQGDLKTLSGAELIVEALLRRLQTPIHGYKRWVRSPSGLIELDTTYGNEAYFYLSKPLNQSNKRLIHEAIKRAAESDPRIQVQSVESSQTANNTLDAYLLFWIKPEQTLRNLDLTLFL